MSEANQSILIVEPDVLIRHPLAEYLRECGYRVIEALDCEEARQFFSQGQEAVDVVLADAATQSDSCFAFATWIRAHYPEVEVILAGTVTSAVQKADDLCEDGPALEKPSDHKAVLNHIRRLMAARDRNRSG